MTAAVALRQRVADWIAPKRATDPIEFHPLAQSFFGHGVGGPNQPTHEVLLRESLGMADTAARAIANRLSTLNPLVKMSRRAGDGTLEDEILDDSPLKRLMDRPHPNLTRAQLLRLTGQYIVTVGEAYWLKVGNGLQLPTELHPIPPQHIGPVMRQGVVDHYEVTDANGRRTPLQTSDVIRFYFPDPEAPWASEGYLAPSGITADSLKFSGQHLRSHYQNDAAPKTALESGGEATIFQPEEREAFWREWRKRYHAREGSERGTPAILPLGYKLIQMAFQSGADIVPLLDHWRDDQLMAYGVPRSVLGQVVSGDRSSAEVNQYVFDRHAVLPIANLIADALTLQLAPDFDAALFVLFEEFVSADKEFQLQQEKQDLETKVRSIHQVRADRGLDPEAAPWGVDPVGKIGEAPYLPDVAFELDLDDEGALEDEEPRGRDGGPASSAIVATSQPRNPRAAAKPAASLSRASFFEPAAEWQRQVAREKKFVPTFERAMAAILAQQQRIVLRRLKRAMPRARVTADELFTVEEWRNLFARRVEPVRRRAFEEILGETLAGLGIDSFVFTDAMRQELREQGAALVQRANATTLLRLRRALEVGTAEGEGIDAIAKRIRGVFSVRRHQARTIARTEILRASQKAQLVGFETSGVVEKKIWHTALDDAVRDEHIPVEGQKADVGSAFVLGDGELADAPGIGAGGGTLSAHNAINCRCFLTPGTE